VRGCTPSSELKDKGKNGKEKQEFKGLQKMKVKILLKNGLLGSGQGRCPGSNRHADEIKYEQPRRLEKRRA